MTSEPVFSLHAVVHNDLASFTKIFSIHDMEYYLWIQVDTHIAKEYSLYQLDEVGVKNKFDLSISDTIQHEPGRIWYKINSMYLNREVGQHVYRMHFVHASGEEITSSLYFSYIVQREDTEKPYIYMPKKDEQKVML